MLRKDILLIINPNASKGRGRKKAKEIQSLFRNMSRECTVAYTRAPGHAESLAKRGALYGYDTIVVAGGDGTVNETVNGIMKSGVSGVRMGIIPIGRGNDFSWMAGIPSKQKKAVELIARGISRKIDVGFCVGTEHPDGIDPLERQFCPNPLSRRTVGGTAAQASRNGPHRRRTFAVHDERSLNISK